MTSSWIPALTGIEDKLKSGVNVAGVGCGPGASTIILAKAFVHASMGSTGLESLSLMGGSFSFLEV